MAEIRWSCGESERTDPLVGDGPFGLGRNADNVFVLADTEASRHHARIVANDNGWAVEDLSSSNGTWVNGRRVAHACLHDGDRIRLGGTELVFQDVPAIPPVAGVAIAGGAAVPDCNASQGTSYHLMRGAERFGPFTWAELTSFAANDQIAPDDMVWGPGFERWMAASSVHGLLPAEPSPAASPLSIPCSRGGLSFAKALLVVLPIAVLVGVLLGFLAQQLTSSGGGGDGGDRWQTAVLGLDDAGWQGYPDLEIERRKIIDNLRGFQSALRTGNIDEAVSFIAEERQGAYGLSLIHI